MYRIIKRQNHTEPYQREKLHGSIHAVCLSVRDFVGAAELTAERVCDHVEQWLHDKSEITSADVRRVAANALERYNPSAAILYETHLNIS